MMNKFEMMNKQHGHARPALRAGLRPKALKWRNSLPADRTIEA
jgi:hypothetical protein